MLEQFFNLRRLWHILQQVSLHLFHLLLKYFLTLILFVEWVPFLGHAIFRKTLEPMACFKLTELLLFAPVMWHHIVLLVDFE